MKRWVPEVTRTKTEGKCRQSTYNYNGEGKMKENNVSQDIIIRLSEEFI